MLLLKNSRKEKFSCKNQLNLLKSVKTLQIKLLLLVAISIVTTFILLSFTIDQVYSQEQEQTDSSTTNNNNNIKLLKYINSRDGYEISYPAGVEIVLGSLGLTITDKNKGWEFVVDSGFSSSYENLEQHVNEIIQEGKDNGYKFLEKKPLTVAGQPAIMINSLYNDVDKGKLKTTQIVMHANDMAYKFAVSTPEDKFDGYASIFFTMLKSFKLIDQK